jgi:hypothetical protein
MIAQSSHTRTQSERSSIDERNARLEPLYMGAPKHAKRPPTDTLSRLVATTGTNFAEF